MNSASSDHSSKSQDLAAAFLKAATAEEVADVVVTAGLAAVEACVGILAVLDDSGSEFLTLGIAGCSPEVAEAWRRFPADAPVPLADVVRDNRPLFLPTLQERRLHYPVVRMGRALVALPILRGKVVGGLGFAFPTDRAFQAEDFDLFMKLADWCGQALERIWMRQTPARRVLIVDDLRDTADSAATLLRLLGHEVRVAYDGPHALEIAREFRPEAVLLDLGLPGMTGYEVAGQLRREPGLGGVLLVAISGYGQDEDRRRSKVAGFDVHLIKPADPEELQAMLVAKKIEGRDLHAGWSRPLSADAQGGVAR